MSRWFFLPAEIPFMILKLLARENRGLASYASVCKEWQIVMEKKNFGRLRLRASCLDDLEHMVGRRRELVKHVWLDIELKTYNCEECQSMRLGSMMEDQSILARAISKLFSILSTWNPVGGGLTLELSAQSPSDSEHWFKNYCFGAYDEDEDGIFELENQG